MPEVGAAILKGRHLHVNPSLGYNDNNPLGTAGRCYLVPIDVPWPVKVDRISIITRSVAGGNVRVCIYKEGATADSPAGGKLLVESASTPLAGVNRKQDITIAETALEPGQVFLGLTGDTTTDRIEQYIDTGKTSTFYYDISGGYGPFTDPCPSLTTSNMAQRMGLRISENLPAGHGL